MLQTMTWGKLGKLQSSSRHPAAPHPLSQRKPQPTPSPTIDSHSRSLEGSWSHLPRVTLSGEVSLPEEHDRCVILTPATMSDSISTWFLFARFI